MLRFRSLFLGDLRLEISGETHLTDIRADKRSTFPPKLRQYSASFGRLLSALTQIVLSSSDIVAVALMTGMEPESSGESETIDDRFGEWESRQSFMTT